MCNVLIIDDEKEISTLLAGMLTKKGYNTISELSVAGGYQTFRKNNFDLVFLDLNLTDGSGFDLIPKLKAENPYVNIFIISAYDGQAERERALRSGATGFIGKPFTGAAIFEAVNQHDKMIQ